MELGLHINGYTWGMGPARIASTLAEIAASAETLGFRRLTVSDHVWQISTLGQEFDEMLECYTALGFLTGRTKSIELFPLVSAASYRSPALLAESVETLHLLSGGRTWLALGAGWNGEEAGGLGLDFPGTRERFRRVEETIRLCLQRWSPDDPALRDRPMPCSGSFKTIGHRPRIMIGGAGERQTLRLVAKYADACNIWGGQDAGHKLEILRRWCLVLGRDYSAIEKTAILSFDLRTHGGTSGLLQVLHGLHELGFTTVHGDLRDLRSLASLQAIGEEVLPVVRDWPRDNSSDVAARATV
jgi:alkanesulfonate monooxygenase SsuD/methylene tetrahydromethanopterin reductase-like flavin-dependent oxidoreductase (luciferase family)